MKSNEHPLTFKTLFSYGSLALPLAMLGLPLYIYLPTFYADTVGVSVTLVGIILFLSRLTDVITDPLVGYVSDNFSSNYGKRKPFIITGAIILGMSFYALINPPSNYVSLWLLLFSMLTYLGWSIISIPYLAWSAEISPIHHEKTRLSASRELFTILGAVAALLIPYLYGVSSDAGESIALLYLFFLFALLFALVVNFLGMKEHNTNDQTSVPLKEIYRLWEKKPQLRKLQVTFLLNSFANALPATLFLFYVELVLGAKALTGALLLLYFTSGILGLPFWTLMSKKLGKAKTWQLSMLLAASAFVFVPFLGEGDVVAFAVISFISGLSLGADMALPSSMQADIVQKLQSTKRNYAGLLFGFWAMLTKLALALAVGVGFVILGLVGFDPKLPTAPSLLTLSLLYGALPVFIKVLSAWMIIHFDDKMIH